MFCPTCGKSTSDRVLINPTRAFTVVDGKTINLDPAEARVLDILYRNLGDSVSAMSIASITGLSLKGIGVHVCHLRTKLYPTKLVIDGKRGPWGGYKLRWLPGR